MQSLIMFRILAALVALPTAYSQKAFWPYQTFETVAFQPPVLKVTRNGTPADGYLFLGQAGPQSHEDAPLIMTDDSELIWQGPTAQTFGFGKQAYNGDPVLVYWNGTIFPEPVGRGHGSIYVLDNTYTQIATVSLAGDFVTATGQVFASNIDLHEIFITKNNTLIVTANNVTQTDLTSVGGPSNGYVVDGLLYEIDIATNEVLFRWSALEHIPVNASLYPLGSEGYDGSNRTNAWGYFHINAGSPYDGGYIISSRYTCSAIAIDAAGNVKWRLQGRTGADFTLGSGTNFCYQHDIRAVHGNSTHVNLHIHDNANCPIDNGTTPTSGLSLSLDLTNKVASLKQRYENPADPIYATAQGSYQALADGHVFLGHGFFPKLEEFDHNGRIVETIQFAPGVGTLSYRAFRQEWTGCPQTKPAVDFTIGSEGISVFVSWNGATEVKDWRLFAGNATSSLAEISTIRKSGFETSFTIPKSVSLVQVEAVLKAGAAKECGYGSNSTKSAVVAVV